MLAVILLPLSLSQMDTPTQQPSVRASGERPWSFGYTYLDLRIAGINNDERFDDGAALISEVSLGIGEHFYLFGFASRDEFDPPANEVVETFAAGAGFHTPMNAVADFQFQLGLTSIEGKGDASDFDETGFTVGFGGRFHFSEYSEVNALVSYADLDDAELYWRAGGVYAFNSHLAGTLQLQYSNDSTVAMVGMRLSP